jgi:hypothetical protein
VAEIPENTPEIDVFATSLPWYAVNVHGRREERFVQQMRDAGVPCYWPSVQAQRRERRREKGRRHEHRIVKHRVPYIPGYVFIAADGNGIYAAKATGLVFSIKPPAIQGKLVKVLRTLRDALSRPQEPPRLMMGRAYEVQSGHLMGKRGRLVKQDGRQCVLRGALLLGCEQDVELDIDLLEPV